MISQNKNIFLAKKKGEALTDLRRDDSIIITKPDKGNGVVIINKLDYLNKMKLGNSFSRMAIAGCYGSARVALFLVIFGVMMT